MSLVVLDIECIENKIVKELGVYSIDKLWDISFFLPKSSKLHLILLGVRSIFMDSFGTVAMKNILILKKVLKKLKAPETEFFGKGYEESKILSEILETKITNLDDYARPKVQNLIFKLKNMIGGVATTHFVMQILFTVQKEKLLHTEHGLDVF